MIEEISEYERTRNAKTPEDASVPKDDPRSIPCEDMNVIEAPQNRGGPKVMKPPCVTDSSTAVEFVKWCIKEIGPGYHPDTPFGDYVDDDGRPCFSPTEAKALDGLTDVAFGLCDPYAVGDAELVALLAS